MILCPKKKRKKKKGRDRRHNDLIKWFLYLKGIEQFQQALQISPQCVSAHYGLASGLLGLAKECIYLGAFQWGATLLEVIFLVFLLCPYVENSVR